MPCSLFIGHSIQLLTAKRNHIKDKKLSEIIPEIFQSEFFYWVCIIGFRCKGSQDTLGPGCNDMHDKFINPK